MVTLCTLYLFAGATNMNTYYIIIKCYTVEMGIAYCYMNCHEIYLVAHITENLFTFVVVQLLISLYVCTQ